jgi:hypothetical protein
VAASAWSGGGGVAASAWSGGGGVSASAWSGGGGVSASAWSGGGGFVAWPSLGSVLALWCSVVVVWPLPGVLGAWGLLPVRFFSLLFRVSCGILGVEKRRN